MLKFILYVIVFYIVVKLIRLISKAFSPSMSATNNRSNFTQPKTKKSTIDKKDIIEAEFEEIKDKENESKPN